MLNPRRSTSLAAALACLALLSPQLACKRSADPPVVVGPPTEPVSDCDTPTLEIPGAGPVCGRVLSASDGSATFESAAYLGIPYAEDTSGDRRWAPPVAKAAWTETRAAVQFGPGCPQTENTFTQGISEDCLSLNVWTPADATPEDRKPVMVFIYGGGFREGGSALQRRAAAETDWDSYLYNGAYTAGANDVVVVTLNYRVGALGFLAGLHDLHGNYGLMDQMAALRWVEDHIEAFGGDPEQVTIYGESAGAMSVGLHLTAVDWGEDPPFRAGIMESNPFGLPYQDTKQAKHIGELLQAGLLCTSLKCLRGKSVDEILEHQERIGVQGIGMLEAGLAAGLLWAPTVDGELVLGQPVDRITDGKLKLPTIIGVNEDEGALFAYGGDIGKVEYDLLLDVLFGRVTAKLVRKQLPYAAGKDNDEQVAAILTDYAFACASQYVARRAQAPVYFYRFTEHSPFNVSPTIEACWDHVCHTAELPYVFHNPAYTQMRDGTPGSFDPTQAALSIAMGRYWTSFARTLDPNYTGAPVDWPAWSDDDGSFIELRSESIVGQGLSNDCGFWDELGYSGNREAWKEHVRGDD